MNQLFKNYYFIGYDTRINSKDGLQVWQVYKNMLNKHKCNYKWRVGKLHGLFEKLHELNSNNNMVKIHHFINKINNIPKNEICSERKIAQLAYNYGQLNAELLNNHIKIDLFDFDYAFNYHIEKIC
jgi:hypothetical protein